MCRPRRPDRRGSLPTRRSAPHRPTGKSVPLAPRQLNPLFVEEVAITGVNTQVHGHESKGVEAEVA